MNNTLIQMLSNSVQQFPDKVAVIHGESRVTYSELWEKSCGLAKYLLDNGLNSEDRVSLLIDNSPEYVIAYYGVLMAGGAVVGLNTAAKSRDLLNWIEHSDSSVLIAHVQHAEFKSIYAQLNNGSINIITVDDSDNEFNNKKLEEVDLSSQRPEIDIQAEHHLASLIYTSGTTGKPKGVMLSHLNLSDNISSILEYLKLNNTDSIVNILPFYYSYGNSVLHTHLAVGGTIILENSLLYPQKILGLMQNEKVTGFSGVPSTYSLLLNRTNLCDFDLSSIRYMTQAGGAMAPTNIEKLNQKLPNIDFFVMYGQTEASARLSYMPAEMLNKKIGSIGISIPNVTLDIRDQQHKSVNQGEVGEIYASGKNIMLGYWKDDEASSKVFYGDWLLTGDLAYKDEDGYIYIVGRSSEMIKSGAHRISPKDIEEVIMELDGVEEVVVIGIDNELLGQAIKAFIVLSSGSNLDKKQIMRHCKMNLANYKLPKQIELTDDIPRTASGKVRRFMLK
ncbi:MAG: acyl--CoA ligase [Gammaproteobacteria bacterium]|nr:acyl--CoA ligase [Gammaproteobacteria bacterium]